MVETLVPTDIPLPLPAPVPVIVGALLISFAAHIFFVNLMLGGSLMVVFTEAMGLKDREWDRVSRGIAATITVNKSLAVVIGVAPLLCMGVFYTVYFYTANALTADVWLMVVPLVIAAFLLSYAHKYSWDAMERNKGLHLALGVGAALLYLTIPFIFLTNINLMLYPEHWASIGSFWNALTLPNVLPRYLHFLAASLALVGLFLAWYLPREGPFRSFGLERLTRKDLRRSFLGVTLAATGAQFLLGPLVFITLPARVVSPLMVTLVFAVVLPLAVLVVWWLWTDLRDERPGYRFWPVVGVLALIVGVMIYARHDVRETAVRDHRERVAVRTAEYTAQVRQAQAFMVVPGGLGGRQVSPGKQAFQRRCSACHAVDSRLVGPSIFEAVEPYAGDAAGIVAWTLNPGRRRMDFPPMPRQNVPRDELQLIAKYMLETAGN
jgi:cytochrome c